MFFVNILTMIIGNYFDFDFLQDKYNENSVSSYSLAK